MVGMNPLNVAKLVVADIKPELEKEIPQISRIVWWSVLLTGGFFGFVIGLIVGWLLL